MRFLKLLPIGLFLAIAISPKASCQEFLKPVQDTAPAAFLEMAPVTSTALLAPVSVNQSQEIPTIEGMTYGFSQGHGLEANPNPGQNGYGAYGSYVLPTVSTGAVNINTVDCPFIGGNRDTSAANGWVYIRGLGWRDLQEYPPEVAPHAILSPVRNPVTGR